MRRIPKAWPGHVRPCANASGCEPAGLPARAHVARTLLATANVLLVLALAGTAFAARVDTRAFNAAFATQSARMYDHLLKAQDYYASLAKEGNDSRIKDALALRASLSACWELFLNAGDMVYVYNQIGSNCLDDATRIGGLVHQGLGVIAGKLEKELEWMGLTEKNVGDQPISVELTQARKDILAAVALFRQTAAQFAPPATGETRQPVTK
jgi:hypothetical protein